MIGVGDLVGLPYMDGGRGPDCYDCYGLAMEVYRRDGKTLPDLRYADHDPALAGLVKDGLPLREVDRPPREMDLLEMVYRGELHVGVAINGREFIHATRLGVRVNPIGLYPVVRRYEWAL